jgi:hypothetical protein
MTGPVPRASLRASLRPPLRPSLRPALGADGRFDFDFRALAAPPAGFGHVRASAAALSTAAGWTAFPAGTALIAAGQGWHLPGPFDQVVGNTDFAGAAVGPVGAGGALPTGWTHAAPAGVTLAVVALGSENGLPFLQLRWSGTNTSGAPGAPTIWLRPLTGAAAAPGQIWTCTAIRTKVAYDRVPDLLVAEHDAAGALLSQGSVSFGAEDGAVRKTVTRTLASAATANVVAAISASYGDGEAQTIEFRLAAPQLYRLPGVPAPAILGGNGAGALTSAQELVSRPLALVAPFSFRIQGRIAPFDPGVGQQIVTWSADADNWLRVIRRTATNVVDVEVWTMATWAANLSLGAVAHDTAFAVAARIDRNDYAASMNGGAIVKDLSGDPPGPLSTLTLGAHPDGSKPWWGRLERLTVWRRGLADAELAALGAVA